MLLEQLDSLLGSRHFVYPVGGHLRDKKRGPGHLHPDQDAYQPGTRNVACPSLLSSHSDDGMCNLQIVVGVGELSDEFRTFFVTRLAAFWILVSEACVS